MIAVLDFGLGNIGSIVNALNKLGKKVIKTNNPEEIFRSSYLIFPGDGAAGKAMDNLRRMNLIKPVLKFIETGKPFLGICLGMQILLSFSEEGNTECLDIIPGSVRRFRGGLKIPQIGWNRIKIKDRESKSQKLFKGIPDNSYFYFINSYYCDPEEKDIIAGLTEYGGEFCSIFLWKNITGVQFHPEKSGKVGFQLLNNLLNKQI